MKWQPRAGDRVAAILAVSGGADSVYLLDISRKSTGRLLVGHYNHGARGKASEADQRFVEGLCKDWVLPLEVGRAQPGTPVSRHGGRKESVPPRFEEKAREIRYAFVKDLLVRHGAKRVLVAHTADDQVETILMRILEGAGISGLKGIPRRSDDGIERPLLDTWREDILEYLRRRKIPYRTDKSNFDTRFERNWIRHVLIPVLEKRYGKAVKKRIYALGERFREIDEFLEATVRRWMRSNVKPWADATVRSFRFPRARYSKLPSVVRKKIVQILFFERLDIAPNERLLEAIDKIVTAGGPSDTLDIGKGAVLECRYDEIVIHRSDGTKRTRGAERGDAGAASFEMPGPGRYERFVWEERGKPAAASLRRLSEGERGALFDAALLDVPLVVRPLRAGDRIRPFGASGVKKVKDILIDRKVPRDERWGRAVVCDGSGEIVWIPGVVRSSIAPVTRETRRAVVLGLRPPPAT